MHNKSRQSSIFHQIFQCLQKSSFKKIEDKHEVNRDKRCMKKFCKSLREYAVKIINFKKKNMELSTKEMQELCETTKIYYI